jgi:hypothetical protein
MQTTSRCKRVAIEEASEMAASAAPFGSGISGVTRAAHPIPSNGASVTGIAGSGMAALITGDFDFFEKLENIVIIYIFRLKIQMNFKIAPLSKKYVLFSFDLC